MDATVEDKLYTPGESLLHRLDPRLKVCACLLLVALAFSSTSWLQLSLPLVLVCTAAFIVSPLPGSVWRACWMLRWLLLFTLTSYVLFAQGRTLFGVSWLSLDGLVMGSMVCVQLLLAVVAATLLSITTPVEALVATFGWFVRPLHWLGCRTEEWQKTLLLTVCFLPTVHEEITNTKSSSSHSEENSCVASSRWNSMMQTVSGFVRRLLNRGDKAAHLLASGDESVLLNAELPAFLPMVLLDKLFVLCLGLIVVAAWLAG